MEMYGDLTFIDAALCQARNVVIDTHTTAERVAFVTAVSGQIVYDSTSQSYWFFNGTVWGELGSSSDVATLQAEVDAIETTIGAMIQADGTLDSTAANALTNVTGATSISDVLTQLDAAIEGADTLAEMNDVTLTAPSNGDFLTYNTTTSQWENVAASSVGGNSWSTIVTDSGTIVSSQISDSLSVTGVAGSGMRTAATTAGTDETLGVAMAIGKLTAIAPAQDTYVSLIGSDLAVSFAGTTDVAPKRTNVEDMFKTLNVPYNLAGANGMLVKTADDIYATAIAAASTTANLKGLNVTNGDGSTGTIDVGLDVNGLTALTPVLGVDEFVVYDVANTENKKVTLTDLSAGIIAAGVSLDDLSDVTITGTPSTDSFLSFDGTDWVNTDVAGTLVKLDVYTKTESNNAFVDVSGDTMTGALNMGTNEITNVGTPTADSSAANKIYVDSKAAGLSHKNAVIAATTGNITLSGTQTIDGVSVVAGDRVLVKDQTAAAENGIYVVDAAGWTRASDFDSISPIDEVNTAAVWVGQGTTLANTGFTVTSIVATLDTDDVTWAQFNGASGVSAGAGLSKTGNTLDVIFGAGLTELPSDGVGIDLYADEALHLTTDGSDDSTAAGSKLQLRIDGSTITSAHAGLKVSTAGITETELNASVAGDGITGGAGTALSVDFVAASPLSITGGKLDIADDAILNAKLLNSAITAAADVGTDVAVELGKKLTVVGGTGLSTTVADVAGDATVTVDWTASTADLSDVSTTAATVGQVLVSDGTDYAPKAIQFIGDITTASTTWAIAHSLGQKFVTVAIYNASDEKIIPQSVTLTDADNLVVTFNVAVAGTISVMGVAGTPVTTVSGGPGGA
jgi:hypothetical protein